MKNLFRKIGFTDSELKIVLFLVSAISFGLLLNFLNYKDQSKPIYDYTKQDSLFDSYDSLKILNSSVIESNSKSTTKPITKNLQIKRNRFSETNTLNINLATQKDLQDLPGIGEKTAILILQKRKDLMKFTKKEDLLKVKGIGKSKFDKIKNLISIN
jgi:competence ComEA-like helix-hairpin-helix protein